MPPSPLNVIKEIHTIILVIEHEGKIHRVDLDFGSTSTSLIGIISQSAGPTGKLWVNPVRLWISGYVFRS